MIEIRKNIKSSLFVLPALALLTGLLFVGCQNDTIQNGSMATEDMKVNFRAKVSDPATVKTRVPDEEYSDYIKHDDFSCDFYLQLETTDDDGNPVVEYGTYEVPSLYEGRLDAKPTDTDSDPEPLNWHSLRGDHSFYGWTFPSGGLLDYGSNPFEDLTSQEFMDAMTQGVPITFKNSAEDDFDTYSNNSIYEQFIGTFQGPVTYVNDGTYVPLTFRHLVSKIFVDEIILNNYGSIQEHLKANMTIYGLPTSATFYPNPSMVEGFDEAENYNNGWPVVVPEYGENDEMTFYIENGADDFDYAWICPEVDFSNLSFSVSINSTESGYNELMEFSGTFKDVVFDRSGVNWDYGDDTDSTVLHAGEMMVIRLILYPGGGGGLSIQILPWSTHDPSNTAHYSHQGIYSDSALNELASLTNGDISDFFSLYGETEMVDGVEENVFYLYSNANLTYTSGGTASLNVQEGYVLDGNGLLITASSSTVNVMNVRNVYLSDGKGNYVFIDPDGYVYTVDPVTFELNPEPEGPLQPDQQYTIDIATGVLN